MIFQNFEMIGLTLFGVLVMIGGPTFFCFRLARTKPAAIRLEHLKSGVAGVLLVFVAYLIYVLEKSLYHFIFVFSEVSDFVLHEADILLYALTIVIPSLVAIALSFWTLKMIVLDRNPRVIRLSIVNLWLMGPLVVAFESYLTQGMVNFTALGAEAFLAFIWSVILLFSVRVALTYGTTMGRELETNYRAHLSQP